MSRRIGVVSIYCSYTTRAPGPPATLPGSKFRNKMKGKNISHDMIKLWNLLLHGTMETVTVNNTYNIKRQIHADTSTGRY